MTKVSVVTGANKGIGFAIVRGLCKQISGTVLVTARNEDRGREAGAKLKEEGLTASFEHLDITNDESITKFVETIKIKYGGIDILCNNAGIAYKVASTAPLIEKAENTLATNFVGTVNVTKALLPLVNEGGRICQVSSMSGILNRSFPDDNNIKRRDLVDSNLTEAMLFETMEEYLTAIKMDDYSIFRKDSAYSFSKCLLTAHTRVMGKILAKDPRKILINSCCPGYVDTDMTSHKGHLTIDEGAVTPLMVCQLPGSSTNGEFYRHEKHYDWENDCYYD